MIISNKKLFGLIGFPLSHSFSAKYFKNKFQKENITDCCYVNFEIKNVAELKKIIVENPNLIGLNITIPHKQNSISLLDELDDISKDIGAVNTIKIERQNGQIKLKGYNTDVIGFTDSVLPYLQNKKIEKALVLGTGGASKAVFYALQKMGIAAQIVSRNELNKTITYREITSALLAENLLIINTTPLGMFPKINEKPELPYSIITKEHILYDLVYNPLETEFLSKGKRQGATCINGLKMLELQAEASWTIWNT